MESVVKLPTSIAPGAREDVQAHIVLDRKVLPLTHNRKELEAMMPGAFRCIRLHV